MTSKVTNPGAKSISLLLFTTLLLVTLVWCFHEDLRTFIDFVRDREAVAALANQSGILGPLVLSILLALQVLIPSLPSEPVMLASAAAYGFSGGFLINWLVSVAASQAVFTLARYAGRRVVKRFIPARALDKWTAAASEKGFIFFLLAFVIPPIPSDIMTYVAGLSRISPGKFLLANLIGRLPLVLLYTLVGASGFKVTPSVIAGLTITGALMLLAWWAFIMRERSIPTSSARGWFSPSRLKSGPQAIRPSWRALAMAWVRLLTDSLP